MLNQIWKAGGGSNAPVAPPASAEEIRGAAWAAIGAYAGIPYNPAAKFLELARGMGLGAPLTPEIELPSVVLQGFAMGILWARAGDWGNVEAIAW